MCAIEVGEYKLNHPEAIQTPAMLVFQDMVEYNIREIIRMCGAPEKIVPHVKTHKSPQVLRMQLEAGMVAFKCATLSEAEMVAGAGGKEIVIAFPITHPAKLERLMALKQSHPTSSISVIAGDPKHVEILSHAAVQYNQDLPVYMDVEVGSEHGTGVQAGEAADQLYLQIARSPGLIPAGIHAYDGHAGDTADPGPRRAVVQANLEKIYAIKSKAARQGLDVPDVIAGGSWSFSFYAEEEGIRVSPGNWIYFDLVNSVMTDLSFKKASAILGQVVDAQEDWDTVTVDIGQKGVSHDPPMSNRFRIMGKAEAELVGQTEEHGVVKLNGEKLEIGDFFLASPGHACMTTFKYPASLAVNGAGDVVGTYYHTARDRL